MKKIQINLTANTPEEKCILTYLEENASEILVEKINSGKKTLQGFFKYASTQARKQAASGANFACVEAKTVFEWAIHYFEEDSIEEEQQTTTSAKPTRTPKQKPVKQAPPTAPVQLQLSFFDTKEDTTPQQTTPIETPFDKHTKLRQEYRDYLILIHENDTCFTYGTDAEYITNKLGLPVTDYNGTAQASFPARALTGFIDTIRDFMNIAVSNGLSVELHHKSTETQTVTETPYTAEPILVDENGEIQENAPTHDFFEARALKQLETILTNEMEVTK